MKRTSKKWDDWESSELERLWKQGLSDRKIGEILGRSDSSIEGKRTELGLIKNKAGTPSVTDLEERKTVRCDKPDLWALWDRRMDALRERLNATD